MNIMSVCTLAYAVIVMTLKSAICFMFGDPNRQQLFCMSLVTGFQRQCASISYLTCTWPIPNSTGICGNFQSDENRLNERQLLDD